MTLYTKSAYTAHPILETHGADGQPDRREDGKGPGRVSKGAANPASYIRWNLHVPYRFSALCRGKVPKRRI